MEDHGQPYTGRLLHADDWDSGGRDPYWPNLVLPLDSDRHPNNDNNKCFFNAAKPKWAWSLPPPVTDARSQVRDGKGVRMSMLPMSRDEVAGLSLVDDCVNEDADTRTVFAHLIKVGTHVRRSEAENLTALDGNDLPIPRCVAFNTVTDTVTESTQQGQPIEPRVECLRMTWIEGQNLKKVFTTMSRTEKMDVARQVIAFMHKLSNVPQHPDYPGIHLSLRTYRPVLKVREGDILQQWGPAKPWSPAVRKSLMLNLFTLRQPVFRTYASFLQGLEDWIIDLFEWHRPINHYSTMGDLAARLAHHITTNLRPTAWSLQPVATHGALSLGNFLVKDGKIVGVTDWSTAGFFPRYWEHFRMLSYIQDAKVSSPDVEFLCQVLYVSNGDWRALYAISYLHRLLVRGPFDGLDNHKFYCLEGRQLELYLIACHVGSRQGRTQIPERKVALAKLLESSGQKHNLSLWDFCLAMECILELYTVDEFPDEAPGSRKTDSARGDRGTEATPQLQKRSLDELNGGAEEGYTQKRQNIWKAYGNDADPNSE